MLYRLFRLNPYNRDDRNAWNLIVEIFWAAMLASATTFNAAFAIRLGASNTTVSLLTSLPALMAVLVSIPAGQFLNTRAQRKPWLLWSLFIYRAGFLLVALSPLISLFNIPSGVLVVLTIVLITPPAHFFNVGFIPLLTELIPEKQRAGVLTWRNIIYNATFSAFGILFGLWLNRVVFPLNYQLMYAFGFACSLLSMYFLIKLQVPDSLVPQRVKTSDSSLTNRWRLFREAYSKRPGFMRMTTNTLLHSIGLWAASPLYVLFYVRSLGASEAWLGTLGSIASLSTIFGYAIWRLIMERWGQSVTLKRTIVLAGLLPILVGLSPSLTLILLIVAINGLVIPGLGLSHINILMKVTPEENRPGYTAVYITLSNIGAFLLPFAGIALANRIGFAPTLILCGALSILGSTSFWWWPVIQSETPPQSAELPSSTDETAPGEDLTIAKPKE